LLTNIRRVVVEWGDCDPAGIVYYPRYFQWFDASTAALFAAVGITNASMHSVWRVVGIPMVDTRARFIIPSKYEDEVTIESSIAEFRRSSFDVLHQLRRSDGSLAVEGHETRVWTMRDREDPDKLRSTPIPDEVKALFLDKQ
jgi:4-hydroxybenzoyl-CoA thioesterase